MTFAEVLEFIKAVGFPAAVAAYVLVRLDRRLAELITAMKDVADPDKTAARFTKVLDTQSTHIIEQVSHDTRSAVQAGATMVIAHLRRDGA